MTCTSEVLKSPSSPWTEPIRETSSLDLEMMENLPRPLVACCTGSLRSRLERCTLGLRRIHWLETRVIESCYVSVPKNEDPITLAWSVLSVAQHNPVTSQTLFWEAEQTEHWSYLYTRVAVCPSWDRTHLTDPLWLLVSQSQKKQQRGCSGVIPSVLPHVAVWGNVKGQHRTGVHDSILVGLESVSRSR